MTRSPGFSLEEIDAALEVAGVGAEIRERVKRTLSAIRKPPGRPREEDDALLMSLAELVSEGLNPHAAAIRVTEQMKEPLRETARKRLYKKYMKDRDLWQQRVDQPRSEGFAKWQDSVRLNRERDNETRGKLDRLIEELQNLDKR